MRHAEDMGCLVDAASLPELKKEASRCRLALKRQADIARPGSRLFHGKLWEVRLNAYKYYPPSDDQPFGLS